MVCPIITVDPALAKPSASTRHCARAAYLSPIEQSKLFDLVVNLISTIRYESLQSDSGNKLLQRSGRSPDNTSSVVLVKKERSYMKSEAVLRIMEHLDLPSLSLP